MTRPADLTDLDQRVEQIADLVAEVRCPNPIPLPRDIADQLLLIDLELTALLVALRGEGES